MFEVYYRSPEDHAREARLLDQRPRAPALLIEGTAFGADGAPVEFARSYVRGDRTRYYVERVVVRASWEADPATAETGAAAPARRPATQRRSRQRRSRAAPTTPTSITAAPTG